MTDHEVADSVVLGRVGFVREGAMGEERFALPSGTVTFLLTDIEGSTVRWEADPDVMAPAVARHYELLDEAIGRWGGVRPVEQGEGDSIVAAFARGSDAVSAAVEAQRALVAELGSVFAVRMALHTGEAQLRDEGNYFGEAVNRCARVRACGHGGQILCTQTLADLVVDRPPDGVAFEARGRHRLRDLGRHESIWQITAPGLRTSFPALRSLDAFRHSLPVALSSFVGRTADLAELRVLVEDSDTRLITLAGAGGCGKTRLALRLAGELLDRYPGGVWWTELAEVSDGAVVARAVLQSAGLREESERSALQVLAGALGDERTLVLLDNCEHVLAEAAGVADELLRHCSGLVIIATSREPLGVPGEVVWRVPSLPAPVEEDAGRPVELGRLTQLESVRLFLDRAHQARPNFVLSEANAPAVAQICSRLDGIPLAIELAAARCRSLTADRIAAELDDRFRLLTGGARTSTPRQQTLLASVDWSHDLLEPAERAVFRRLAVFAGPFTLDAAEAVCADGQVVQSIDVLDLVSRLVDKSLVAPVEAGGAEVRFRLLETIRQYALDRCQAADELAQSRDRHLDHYLTVVTGMDHQPDAPQRASREYANIRAALVWSAATPDRSLTMLCEFAATWSALGRFGDVRALAPALLEQGRFTHPALWARAVASMADPMFFAGQLPIQSDLLEARAIAEEHGDDGTVSRALYILGLFDMHGDAVALWDRGAELGRRAGDIYGESCAWLAVNHRLARGVFSPDWQAQAIALTEALDHSTVANATSVFSSQILTWQPFLRGDLGEAERYIERAAASVGPDTYVDAVLILAASMAYLGLLTANRHTIDRAIAIRDGIRGDFGDFIGPVQIKVIEAVDSFDRHTPLGDLSLLLGSDYSWRRDLATGALLDRQDPAVALPGAADGPYAECRHALAIGALAAQRDDVDGTAEASVHEALRIAAEHGYRPTIVECLETLAALSPDRVAAGRLLGAAGRQRDEMGLRFRFPHLERLLDEQRQNLDADALAAGAQLDLTEAIDYAGRGRGKRSRPDHGWASLTPTEVKVVELVTAGRTNPEIGEQLLMSRSTVKTHLAHVFTKLGVTSRAELAARTVRHGTG